VSGGPGFRGRPGDPAVDGPSQRDPKLRLFLELARCSLVWERVWPRLFPVFAVVSLFLTTSFFDILPVLPKLVHGVSLVLFSIAFAAALRHFLGGDYGVEEAAVRRRLESDSGFVDQPLSALEDRPINAYGDTNVTALWRAHQARMAVALARLRVAPPSPGLPRRDRFGLRILMLLALFIGAVLASGDIGPRLERAVKLGHTAEAAAKHLLVELWVTPPPYTGLAPLFLDQVAGQDEIKIPVGSTLLAQMGGARGRPEIFVGSRAVPFEPLGDPDLPEGYRVETKFADADASATTLSVLIADKTVAQWKVRGASDSPPSANFPQPPQNLGRGRLGVTFEAKDDYAVTELRMEIRHAESWLIPGGGGDKIQFNLPVPSLGTSTVKGNSSRDLSAHQWAGAMVEITLHATDAAGQSGVSDAFPMALPERIFNHPVARAIVAARRKLNRPVREDRTEVVDDLTEIARHPQHFFGSTVIFVALAVARNRLVYGNFESVASVQKLLWETALKIEDGEFTVAERNFKDIQRLLMEAMRNGAEQHQITRLMEKLQRAMDLYMGALVKLLKRRGLDNMPMNPTTRMMEGGDFQRIVDKARKLAETGAMDAAQQLLSELNQMLDAVRNSARTEKPQKAKNQASKMRNELRSLAQRQQKLLDKTFRRVQRDRAIQGNQSSGQQGQKSQSRRGNGETQVIGEAQAKMRRELSRMMLEIDELLGAISPSLGRADRAMKRAHGKLGHGDSEGAVLDQAEAVEQLGKAYQGMFEHIARGMQKPGSVRLSIGGGPRQMLRGRDPFGRQPGGGASGGSGGRADGGVKIPTGSDIRQTREILIELRRRSGEHQRPEQELDYIERLIRPF